MYYVYRFLNKVGEVIYVGKTGSMKNRMSTHFGNNGHLPPECYAQTEKVEFKEYSSKIDMDIHELYYINVFHPTYNKKDKRSETISTKLEDSLPWITFWEKDENNVEIINDLKREIKELNKEIDELREDNLKHKRNYEESLKYQEELKGEMKELIILSGYVKHHNKVQENTQKTWREMRADLDKNKDKVYKSDVIVNGSAHYSYRIFYKIDGIHFIDLVNGEKSEKSFQKSFGPAVSPWFKFDSLVFEECKMITAEELRWELLHSSQACVSM